MDLDDLRRHCRYTQYEPHHDVIRWLWEVLAEFTPEQMADFLMFTTACSRPPLLGFGKLYPPFCIQWIPNDERLPTR